MLGLGVFSWSVTRPDRIHRRTGRAELQPLSFPVPMNRLRRVPVPQRDSVGSEAWFYGTSLSRYSLLPLDHWQIAVGAAVLSLVPVQTSPRDSVATGVESQAVRRSA